MNLVLSRNLGRFRMTRQVTKDPKAMACFFEIFTIVRLELELHTGLYWMLCESEVFENVPDSEPIPQYQCEMKKRSDGSMEITNVFKV